MSDIIVTLNKKIDRTTINADTTIRVVNNYASEAFATGDIVYSTLTTDEKEALNVVLDRLTYIIEGGAFVFTINRSGKTFDLTDSFVRDAQSTETPTDMTVGQSLLVRFEVAGFTTNSFREISLFYGEDFISGDLDDLSEIGISITGTGASFTIDNTQECRVTFSKPEIITDVYVINDVEASTIIEV